MALRKSHLRIDKASLLETFSCLKIRTFGYTPRCLCFTSFSYQISLFKCLINRSFKIYNNWNSFHNDIENIKSNLIKNAYPPFLIDKVIKKYLDYKFSSNQNQLKDKSDVHYFKLPYIGNLSHHIKNKTFETKQRVFLKKILTLSLFLAHSKLKIIFHIKIKFLMI